ncbi:MAG: Rrf2 family transcriptional regulator [Endomicrobium sp.]|jgi:Rrf2 family protein|nr:Rrf2 family transcriptional regulator [Endomicrobium sp.]
MRISAKARYGLAAMISIAQKYNTGEITTVISLSEKLKISKIYLEQVFSLLKRADLVNSTKGSQGGYQLAAAPKEITAFDILSSIEAALFEKTSETISQKNHAIEKTMQDTVFKKLDENVENTLKSITLAELVNETEKNSSEDGYMFYL